MGETGPVEETPVVDSPLCRYKYRDTGEVLTGKIVATGEQMISFECTEGPSCGVKKWVFPNEVEWIEKQENAERDLEALTTEELLALRDKLAVERRKVSHLAAQRTKERKKKGTTTGVKRKASSKKKREITMAEAIAIQAKGGQELADLQAQLEAGKVKVVG